MRIEKRDNEWYYYSQQPDKDYNQQGLEFYKGSLRQDFESCVWVFGPNGDTTFTTEELTFIAAELQKLNTP